MTTEPHLYSAELIQKGRDFLVSIYRQRERILDHGKGSRVWDSEGREYVDFAAGIAVSALGHGDPDILAALHEQAGKLWHTSNAFYSEPPLRLAEELVAASGFAKRVFFCNSGSEAIEATIKLVRRWADAQGRPPERRVIMTFAGSFHGRTLAAVTATAQPRYQQGFEPLPGGFRHRAFNDLDALDAAFDGSVAAVIVEPIQGEGGVVPAAEGFLEALRERCDRHGALLVFDEIQCGVGRTGKLWAHQWDDVKPDVMTVAKGLGCGFPIGAMLVGKRAADTLQYGSHGSTFGGNPLAAAVARVALRKLSSPELLTHVSSQGLHLQLGLERIGNSLDVFSEVRGRGLMLGAALAPAYAGRASDALDFAADEGLLLLQAGPDVLRFVPALNIPADDIDDGMDRLETALKRLTA
ncbi:MAG: aspartate aminotransferase family protein [Dokdonella sp.]